MAESENRNSAVTSSIPGASGESVSLASGMLSGMDNLPHRGEPARSSERPLQTASIAESAAAAPPGSESTTLPPASHSTPVLSARSQESTGTSSLSGSASLPANGLAAGSSTLLPGAPVVSNSFTVQGAAGRNSVSPGNRGLVGTSSAIVVIAGPSGGSPRSIDNLSDAARDLMKGRPRKYMSKEEQLKARREKARGYSQRYREKQRRLMNDISDEFSVFWDKLKTHYAPQDLLETILHTTQMHLTAEDRTEAAELIFKGQGGILRRRKRESAENLSSSEAMP